MSLFSSPDLFHIKHGSHEMSPALLWNDDETVWSASKSSATFSQHDVAADSYSLLDSIDRPAAAWNVEGDLAFIDDGRKLNDIPFERPCVSGPSLSSVYGRLTQLTRAALAPCLQSTPLRSAPTPSSTPSRTSTPTSRPRRSSTSPTTCASRASSATSARTTRK